MGPKSLIKLGWWLQSIHKSRLMVVNFGQVVKGAVVLVRLGGFLLVLPYTLVGRNWFPERSPDQVWVGLKAVV